MGTASVLNEMKFTFYWRISSFFFALSCRKITIIPSAPPRIDDIERAADPCRRRLALKIMINGGNKFKEIINWFRVSMGSTTEKSIIWSPGTEYVICGYGFLQQSDFKAARCQVTSITDEAISSVLLMQLIHFKFNSTFSPLKRLNSRNQQNAKLDVNEFIFAASS